MKIDEIEITVPWGHIAVKIWGNLQDPPVLVIHGLIDNAGSFDRLIPILPKTFCYICIELPGHGKSSYAPPFLPFYPVNNVIVYKLVMRHFKKQKYIIMGHSFGGQIAFLFAQLYPEYVEKLILLDVVRFFPVGSGHFKRLLRDKFDGLMALEKKIKGGKRPTYTYTEALQRIQQGRQFGFINSEAAEALLKRAITPVENGKYAFTLDPRMKEMIIPLHGFQYAIETIKKFPVTCPVLVIFGDDSDVQRIYMQPIINFLKKYENMIFTTVEGGHDVHNNNPEIVAPHISKFLLTQKGKL